MKGDYKKGQTGLPESISGALTELKNLMAEMYAQERPNFFRIGYYSLKNPGEDVTKRDIGELNQAALTCLNENFMNEFLEMLTS